MKSIAPHRTYLAFCLVLVFLKLTLVANNEIISIQDDSAVYAQQSIGPWAMGYPQGYPLWLSLCQILNIPQRICIEVLYLIGAVLVGYALSKCFSALSGYVAVSVLSFSPSTYFLFDWGLTDGFFTALTLLAISLTLLLFTAQSASGMYFGSVLLGLLMGLMAITRNEDPVLALWIISLVAIRGLLLQNRLAHSPRWSVWKRSIYAGMTIFVSASAVVFSLCLSYYISDGVFARAIALLPGHVQLLKNLAQIDTGKRQVRFIPISRKSRELAYSVSPTFAKLRPFIEDPNDSWQAISRQFGTPDGEIGGGWIWHAINTKLIAMSGNRPAVAEAEYKKINAELAAGFQRGQLRRRFILHPLLGGDVPALLAALPASFSAVAQSAFSAIPGTAVDQNFNPELFDRAFVRRAYLLPHEGDVTVQGWAFANQPGKKISSVSVTAGLSLSAPVIPQDRPDVVKMFQHQNGWKPEVVGFRSTLKSPSSSEVKVTYILEDGTRLQADHLKPMQISNIADPSKSSLQVMQGVDIVQSASNAGVDLRRELELRFLKFLQSQQVFWFGVITIALAFLLSVFSLKRFRDPDSQIFVAFYYFAAVSWLIRVVLYSMIDARSWPGNQIRYLAPANAIGLVMFSVSVGALLVFARKSAGSGKAASFRRVSQRDPLRTAS